VLEWVPRDRVESLPLWQGDKIFLRMIADPQTPFFSLKLEYRGEELVRAALDGRPLELN
jgi:8-oxo-dGTP diphosphatase